MFDGQIEAPLQLLLLFAAAVLAAPLAIKALLRPRAPRPRTSIAVDALTAAFFVLIALVLAPLNLVHNQTGESLPMLFGSEVQDVGVAEWLTALNLALFSGGALWLARGADRVLRVGLIVLAVGAFIVAGEEVSWGQWLFGFESPEFFAEKNLQQESNLHNFIAAPLFNPLYAMAGLVLIGSGLWLRWGPRAALVRRWPTWLLDGLDGRWLAPLMLMTGVLIQHEVFEELAECSGSALLLCAVLGMIHARRRISSGTELAPDAQVQARPA